MKLKLLPIVVLLGQATLGWADGPQEISWDQLIPQDSGTVLPGAPAGAPPDASSPIPQAVGVVETLDGQAVRIPGFIVPLESDEGGLLAEFFLVPYFGACIHVPPPPPNQIVYVTVKPPFDLESMWEPFWIEGTMRTKGHASVIGTTAYSLEASKIEVYEY